MTLDSTFLSAIDKANKDVSDILEGLKREFTKVTSEPGSCSKEVVGFGFKLGDGFREVISHIVKLEDEVERRKDTL